MDTRNRRIKEFLFTYKTRLFVVLLTALTIGVYAQVVGFDFTNFDDDNYVSNNSVVKKGLSLEGLKYAFSITKEKRAYWHPLTWLSHMVDCQVFGLNAGMHHMSNVLLHILNSLLLFFVFKFMSGAFLPSALIALLFALHPLSVDSVAWIAERKNVLSTLFWLLTMLAYIHYSQKPGKGRYLLFFFVFILGLLAKPMLVTLPCALLLMDFWPMNRMGLLPVDDSGPRFSKTSLPKLIVEKVPFLIVSFLAIFISSHSLKVLGVYVATLRVPMSLRIENAIVSYVKYVGKIIWPANLSVYYPFPASIPTWQVLFAAMLLFAISALVIWQIRTRPWLSIGWFWFLGTLFPVSGLIQGGLWPEMADRWAYVPQIGIFIMIAWPISFLINTATTPGKVTTIATGTALLIMYVTTWTQIGYWKNSKVLFYHAMAVTGENSIAHRNLGNAFHQEKDYDKAIEHFRKGIKINPRYPDNHLHLGDALLAKKANAEAIYHYKKAAELNPKDAYSLVQVGALLKDEGNPRQAIEYLNKALAIDPEDVWARHNLGLALAATGDFKAAEKEVLKALSMEENKSEGLYSVGAFYGKYDKQDQAREYLERALQENPEHQEANYNLGIIAVDQNRIEDAEQYFLTTLNTNPKHIDALNNLGLLYAKTGRPGKAIKQYKEALEIDPKDSLVRFNLADTMLMINEATEAIGQFTKILEIEPDHEGARLGLTEIQRQLDRIDSEIARTDIMLAVDPEDPTLLVSLGDLYLDRGDPRKALEYYLKLHKLLPKHPGVLGKSAATYARLAEYEKALAFFKDIVTVVPEKPEGYYNVACMYSRLNKTDQALEWLRQAIDRGYKKLEKLEYDEDLENVRNAPGFKGLMGRHS